MSDFPVGPDWWQASDGKWYPPQPSHPTSPPSPGGHLPGQSYSPPSANVYGPAPAPPPGAPLHQGAETSHGGSEHPDQGKKRKSGKLWGIGAAVIIFIGLAGSMGDSDEDQPDTEETSDSAESTSTTTPAATTQPTGGEATTSEATTSTTAASTTSTVVDTTVTSAEPDTTVAPGLDEADDAELALLDENNQDLRETVYYSLVRSKFPNLDALGDDELRNVLGPFGADICAKSPSVGTMEEVGMFVFTLWVDLDDQQKTLMGDDVTTFSELVGMTLFTYCPDKAQSLLGQPDETN